MTGPPGYDASGIPLPPPPGNGKPLSEYVADRLAQLRAALLDSRRLDSIQPPRAVIDGLLYSDGVAWLYGKPGTYKSVIAIDWACCVAAGLPWQDHETRQGPVLYVYAEGVAGLPGRVRAWEDHADTTSGVAWLPVAVQLGNPIDLGALCALVADTQPLLVVLDTQARVTLGVEENSAMEMGRVVDAAGQIVAAWPGACLLIVHHESRHGEGLRGSIAIEGSATSLFRAEHDGAGKVTLTNTRQRDTAEAEPFTLWRQLRGASVVLTSARPGPPEPAGQRSYRAPRPARIMAAICAALAEVPAGLTSNAVKAAVTGKATTVALALELLIAEGYVTAAPGPRRAIIHTLTRPYAVD